MIEENTLRKIAIVLAYEPPSAFIDYAQSLSAAMDALVVVNDGSGERFRPIFDWVATLPNATVISYPQNRGKGYALKQAFRHCGEHFSPEDILVTADCDGQHSLSDVLAVCDAAAQHRSSYVLGARDFFPPQCAEAEPLRQPQNAVAAAVSVFSGAYRQPDWPACLLRKDRPRAFAGGRQPL